MTAHNNGFPWKPYYGHFNFFETKISSHNLVASVKVVGDGLYELQLTSGNVLRIFGCECYSYGVAEFVETTKAIGSLHAIIINSIWCGYTHDAKRLARQNKVGLFRIGDFMAALNTKEIWEYLNRKETEVFQEN